MMTYDERVVFEKLRESAYQLECKGKYNSAIERYEMAAGYAKESNDSAYLDVEVAIARCKEKQNELTY